MMGASFAYVPILMAIGADFGIAAIFGSQLVGSILVIIVGLFIKKIRVLFPPLVTGTVILSIGLSLFPVAIKYMAGGAGSADFGSARNWLVALLTFAIVFYFNYFAKGFLKLSAILNGMVIGYLISLALGMVSFEPVQNAKIVQVITLFHFGLDFQLVPIFTLVVMFIVDAVQAIGQFTATTVGAMDRDATDEELSGGIMGSGFTNFIGSLFGSIPVATFGQNVGLVTVTKVINKYVLVFASVILLIAGFVPKVAALLTTTPYAVIGGATISVFASISMTGIRMIASQEMTPRNTGVVGTALAFGIVEVLQKIQQTGSLNLAAKEMKMSYNKAWRIVRVAEEELSFPLIIKSVGGCNGGGSIVTDQGKELIDQYLLFEKKVYQQVEACFEEIFKEQDVVSEELK